MVVWIEINSVSIYYLIKKCINCKKKITPVVQIKIKHESKVVIIDFVDPTPFSRNIQHLESLASIQSVGFSQEQMFDRVTLKE